MFFFPACVYFVSHIGLLQLYYGAAILFFFKGENESNKIANNLDHDATGNLVVCSRMVTIFTHLPAIIERHLSPRSNLDLKAAMWLSTFLRTI